MKIHDHSNSNTIYITGKGVKFIFGKLNPKMISVWHDVKQGKVVWSSGKNGQLTKKDRSYVPSSTTDICASGSCVFAVKERRERK